MNQKALTTATSTETAKMAPKVVDEKIGVLFVEEEIQMETSSALPSSSSTSFSSPFPSSSMAAGTYNRYLNSPYRRRRRGALVDTLRRRRRRRPDRGWRWETTGIGWMLFFAICI